MIALMIHIPALIFAGWFWYRAGKWAYLHGKPTYRSVIATYQRLARFKAEAVDLYKKQG